MDLPGPGRSDTCRPREGTDRHGCPARGRQLLDRRLEVSGEHRGRGGTGTPAPGPHTDPAGGFRPPAGRQTPAAATPAATAAAEPAPARGRGTPARSPS